MNTHAHTHMHTHTHTCTHTHTHAHPHTHTHTHTYILTESGTIASTLRHNHLHTYPQRPDRGQQRSRICKAMKHFTVKNCFVACFKTYLLWGYTGFELGSLWFWKSVSIWFHCQELINTVKWHKGLAKQTVVKLEYQGT